MLTFFRRIRKGLLEGGATSKYMLYAIGEIALVVLGILIALQINNWNEDRKDRIIEKKLLAGVHTNLIEDTVQISNIIEYYGEMRESSEIIKNHMSSELPYDSSLAYHFAHIGSAFLFTPDQAVFENIKGHGINIIRNEGLRLAISDYYNFADFVEYASDLYNLSRDFRANIYPKYFKDYRWGQHATPVDYEDLKTRTDFLMALDYVTNDSGFYRGRYGVMKNRAKSIMELIKEDLDDSE